MAKSEIRRHKVARYTAVPQAMLEDSELSEKEVGIYARILALPEFKKSGEPFDFSVEGYCTKYHGDSRKGCKLIYSGLNALVEAGWIVRTQEKGDNGRWGKVIYDLLPLKEKPHTEKRQAEKGNAIKWDSEKGKQNNIDKTNTEERRSLKPSSTKKQTGGDFSEEEERQVMWFAKTWNESRAAHPDSRTTQFTAITDKRKRLVLDIFKMYERNNGTSVRIDLINKGIRTAMTNKRAQGLVKGMTAPADLNYMLENFVKLVEGTF